MFEFTYRNQENQEEILKQFPELSKLINNLTNNLVSRRHNLTWFIFKEPEYGEFTYALRNSPFRPFIDYPDTAYKVFGINEDTNEIVLGAMLTQKIISVNYFIESYSGGYRYFEDEHLDSYLEAQGAWFLLMLAFARDQDLYDAFIKTCGRSLNIFGFRVQDDITNNLAKELGYLQLPVYQPTDLSKVLRDSDYSMAINKPEVYDAFKNVCISRELPLDFSKSHEFQTRMLEEDYLPVIVKSFRPNELLLLRSPKGHKLVYQVNLAFSRDGYIILHDGEDYILPLDSLSNLISCKSGFLRLDAPCQEELIEGFDLYQYGYRIFNDKESAEPLVSDNKPLTRQQRRQLEREKIKKEGL